MSDEKLVWIDLETTGLDAYNEVILEVGLTVTNLDLKILDECEVLVWDDGWDRHVMAAPDLVTKMHTQNHLLADAESKGVPLQEAEQFLINFIQASKVTLPPMCGSSVGFDRSFLFEHMLDLNKLFHYRNIDISSLKELCRRLNPELYGKLETHCQKKELHRARSDIHDTLQEAGFYIDNFLFVTIGSADD